MSSEASSVSVFSPMVSELQDTMERYLPDSSERGRTILESSSIAQIYYASLKNVPYAYLSGGEMLEKLKELSSKAQNLEFTQIPKAIISVIGEAVCSFFQMLITPEALDSRITFVEATSMAVVSAVHNLFFAVIYTCFSVMTLGFSKKINLRCRIHWAHFVYGFVGSGIGILGVISPFCGVSLSLLHGVSILNGFRKSYARDVNLFERPFLEKIKIIVHEWRETIHSFTKTKVGIKSYNEDGFQTSLWKIEHRINIAKSMDDLYILIADVWNQWPKVGILDTPKIQTTPSLAGSPAAHDYYERK